jgi:hypothetical protein
MPDGTRINGLAIRRLDSACYLSDSVYACELTGGAVLLDLRSLQYSALDTESLPALRCTIRDWVQNNELCCPDDADVSSATTLFDGLRAKGFLCTRASPRPFFSDTPRPTTACAPNWNLRASVWLSAIMLFQIFWAYPRTVIFLRFRRLRPLLTSLSCVSVRETAHKPISPQALQRLVTLFAKLRVWFYTARAACLLDSLVLASVLRRHNVAARLHIGVTLRPFSAHAWVQVGSCVLDDSVANVCEYTPILVI